jgi:hypothetical protein
VKFFISSLFAMIVGGVSVISILALVFLGHLIGMKADVAISCFVGLISIITASFFLSFVALAQEIVRSNKR